MTTRWKRHGMGRASPLSLGACVLLVAAGAAMAGPGNGAVGTTRTDSREEVIPLDDYLLGQDFVVLGRIDTTHRTATGMLPLIIGIRVETVLLGSVPRQRVILRAIPRFAANEKALAWGTWDRAHDDTCHGNALEVGTDGRVLGRPVRSFTLDGTSVNQAGFVDRLRARLAARAYEHPAEWLASGRAVALVRITSVARSEGILGIAPLGTLAGHDGVAGPRILRLPVGQLPALDAAGKATSWIPCHFVGHVGDSLIISVPKTPTDPLDVPTCLGRLQLRGIPYATVFGVRLDQLGQVLTPTPEGLRLNRIHGIDRRSP